MFKTTHEDQRRPKCYFTYSVLPAYVDHAQLPIKKRPFATIKDQAFNHTLDVLLPASKADTLRSLLEGEEGRLYFANVYMKLSDVVSGDFFNRYIKSSGSNILMLSSSRSVQDNIFSLHEGILRLEVDKPTFERMGLEGKAIPSEGRKHVKARYAIELNLRLPSMVRGKHGFERILWAFRNVLNSSVEWLFCDLKGSDDGEGVIAAHAPTVHRSECRVEEMKGIKVPHFPTDEPDDHSDADDDNDDYATDLLEWLSLALMESPRIRDTDLIDSALSRYQVPSTTNAPELQDLVHLQWHGLIPPTFIQKIFLLALKASGVESWFAVRGKAFDGKTYAFVQKGEHTLTWGYED